MANKAKRLFCNLNESEQAIIYESLGEIDEQATHLKQARYINNLLDIAQEQAFEIETALRKCGGCCLSNNAIKIARKLYGKATSVEEFLTFLNEADIGGKHLHLKDGKIIAIYKKCYCNNFRFS